MVRSEEVPCPRCTEPFPHHLLWMERTRVGVVLTYRCIACTEVFCTSLTT